MRDRGDDEGFGGLSIILSSELEEIHANGQRSDQGCERLKTAQLDAQIIPLQGLYGVDQPCSSAA